MFAGVINLIKASFFGIKPKTYVKNGGFKEATFLLVYYLSVKDQLGIFRLLFACRDMSQQVGK